jgi:hypothetical protein
MGNRPQEEDASLLLLRSGNSELCSIVVKQRPDNQFHRGKGFDCETPRSHEEVTRDEFDSLTVDDQPESRVDWEDPHQKTDFIQEFRRSRAWLRVLNQNT